MAQAERKAAGRPYYIRDIPEEEWQAVPESEYQRYLPKSDKWKQKYQPPAPPDTEDLPALPAGWVWATVEQVIELSQNGFGKRRSKSGIPTIVLRLADIESGEKIDLSDVRRIKLEPDEIDKYRLNKDDLLCIRVNGSPDLVGRFIRFAGADEPIAFCDHFIRFKFAISDLSKFMRLNLNTNRVRKYVEHNKVSSAGQNTVSQGTMQSLAIPLPPLPEQRRIVEEVERRLSVVQEVEATVEANLTRAARLRQSILKRAFEGRLVPQHPDDEPVDALLARIRAEKG